MILYLTKFFIIENVSLGIFAHRSFIGVGGHPYITYLCTYFLLQVLVLHNRKKCSMGAGREYFKNILTPTFFLHFIDFCYIHFIFWTIFCSPNYSEPLKPKSGEGFICKHKNLSQSHFNLRPFINHWSDVLYPNLNIYWGPVEVSRNYDHSMMFLETFKLYFFLIKSSIHIFTLKLEGINSRYKFHT